MFRAVFLFCLILLTVFCSQAFAASVEPSVYPVDASITPYTSYISPGIVAYKTAYWGGGTGTYNGYLYACTNHSTSSEDVYVKVGSYWYSTYYISRTTKTKLYFGVARFDASQPGTTHKQKIYIASGGASGYAYSVAIEN